jgi:hypothetical protein
MGSIMFDNVQTFEEEFGSKIKLPSEIIKFRNLLGIAYDFRFNKEFQRINQRIREYHNIHQNKRCFIIGTGPSLNKTKFNLIKDEILIGVNTLYRGIEKFKIYPQYWVVVDGKLFEVHYEKLLTLDPNKTTLFLAEHAGQRYLSKEKYYQNISSMNPIVIKHLGSMNIWDKFSKDITEGIYSGATVIIQAIQIAYYLGFSELYLLGCDSDYSGKHRFDGLKAENENKSVKYMADYHWEYIFSAYEKCKKAFEEDGRKIYNATVGGKLEVFERKSLNEIM